MKPNNKFLLGMILVLTSACKYPSMTEQPGYTSPSVLYGDLFKQVQLQQIFPDSKTFPDCIPNESPEEIMAAYNREQPQDLKQFVLAHFSLPQDIASGYKTDTTKTIDEHIHNLWKVLERHPDAEGNKSSLIPLPNSYVVPGGRFREVYYWDSYFTMLGLLADGEDTLVISVLDNFAWLTDKLGHIPNGNRSYYINRSQPPFFAAMVDLLAQKDGDSIYQRYMPALEKEYDFWMDKGLNSPERLTKMDNGSMLNHYWAGRAQPREESYLEDYELAQKYEGSNRELYRHVRAACESGWDFSSRWFADGRDMATINTVEVIPVDLNCILYFMERCLAKGYHLRRDYDREKEMLTLSENRKAAIQHYLWDDQRQFYFDYNKESRMRTNVYSLAAVFPLYFGLADEQQAKAVADKLEADFLKAGGLITTLQTTGQQWDAPNGWAPLEWMAIQGLKNYKYDSLAETIKNRWLQINEKIYTHTGKMMEKYNVVDTSVTAGGGEYPLQDGFGWTNGVYSALKKGYFHKGLRE